MKTPINALIATLGLTMLSPILLHAGNDNGNPNPGIVSPHATFKGKTAGEWTAAWWQWVRGTPGSVQMTDTTGDFAYVNNNGADGVFFLAKSWTEVPEVRTIEIPAGTPLYVPFMGWGPSAAPGEFLAQYGSVESLFEELISPDILGVHDLSLEVNGVPAAALEDGNLHYLNFVEDGDDLIVPIWFEDAQELREIAGYEFSAILKPLPPGKHTVRLKGTWSDDSSSFASDVTYHITVLPGKGTE
ncbi:MAG: hypothetical protein R3F19_23110 [Verrucomicrobiales bacterium]